MKMKIGFLSLILATLLMTACGGSDGGTTPDPTPTPDPEPEVTANTGILLDSPVAGIQYRTETKNGVTNANGEYKYLSGEEVVFFIGDLEFPSVTASGVVTPIDIAAGNDTMQTNILQILQTLDSDGNPDNGITIYEEAATAFAGAVVDVYSPNFDTEVESVLASIGGGIELVSESAANDHFEKSLKSQILGSWLYSEGDGMRNVLTFIDENRYIIIHEHSDEPGEPGSQAAGSVEYGNYTWDTATGDFAVTLIDESDGWGGLYDGGSTATSAAVLNKTLTLHLVEDNSEYDVNFTRVPNPDDSIVGAYIYTEEDNADSIHVLTILSEAEYVIAHNQNQEAYDGGIPQALSGEFGALNYDASSQSIHVMMGLVDSDGPGGLHNGDDASYQVGESIEITEKGHLIFNDHTKNGTMETLHFARIAGVDAPTPKIPETFTKEWLQGKTLYSVWHGEGKDTNGDPIPDVDVAIKLTFNADETLTVVGLKNHNNHTATYGVLPSGLLYFDGQMDAGNTIACGSTTDYIKTHYTEDGVFDNVDLFFFDETEAMAFLNELSDFSPEIIPCPTAKKISYLQSDLTGTWYSTGTITPNKDGTIAANSWAEAGTMTIASDGAYTWTTNDDSDSGVLNFLDSEKGTLTDSQANDHLGWYMNAGKNVITLVFNNTADNEQGTITWVKAADSYMPTDLAGTWYSVGVGTPNKAGDTTNYWANAGTLTVEENGAFDWTTDSESGFMTISETGLVNIGATESDVLGWYMNAGKDVMTIVFNNTTENEQGTLIVVKKAADAYTPDDLTGTWHAVGTITPNANATVEELSDNYWAEAGTVTIQSDGSYEWITNDDWDSGSLEISAEGVITEAGETDVLGWYLSAGKDVMTLVFNNTTDHEQGIITFVKQK